MKCHADVDAFNNEHVPLVYNKILFKGSLPSEIGLLPNLLRLNLSVNMLTGSVPSEIALLTQLTLLDLSFNLFTGT